MSSSLRPWGAKTNFMFGLNAVLTRLWKGDCSRDFRGFEMDVDEAGLEGPDSELVSFGGSGLVFVSSVRAGRAVVTTGLSIDDDVARLPRLAQFAPAGNAEVSVPPAGLSGEVSGAAAARG